MTIVNLAFNIYYTFLQYQYIAETKIYHIWIEGPRDILYTLQIGGGDVSLYNKLLNIRYRYEH